MALILKCFLFAIATFEHTLSSKWRRDTSLDNKSSLSGHGLTSRSLIRCAGAFATNSTCLSFFVLNGQPENCMILSIILHPESPDLADVPGSVYYIIDNVTSTTTVPTTTTTSSTTTAAPTTTTTTLLTSTAPTVTATTLLTTTASTVTTTTLSTTTTAPATTTTTSLTATTAPATTTTLLTPTAPATTTTTFLTTTTSPSTTTTTPSTTITTTSAPSTTTTTPSTITTAPLTTSTTTCPTFTPSGTYPAFACPADDTLFRTVTLTDNTLMTYRVFKTQKNHTDSLAICASQCGFLARVTTVAKMNMLLALASCPGYSADDYHLDGSNAHSGPTWDSWIMANNEPVPMSADFWYGNNPTDPTIQHCFRMKAVSGHKWDDCPCSATFFFICEK